METEDKNELQTLLNLNRRMLALEKLAANYIQSPKALKLCIKLIKIESKELKKCNPVSSYQVTELLKKYEILTDIVKRLIKSGKPGENSKAVDDLHAITEQTQQRVSEINEQLNPLSENVRKLAVSIDGTAKKLSKTLESGTQMLSDKVTEAVDGIKKILDNKE